MEERVQGLDLGADNYPVKPFDVNEVVARLCAVIRRQGGQAVPISSYRFWLPVSTGMAGYG